MILFAKNIYILCLISILSIGSNCFAEWRNPPEINEETDLKKYFNSIEKEFLLPNTKSKTGTIIRAAEAGSGSKELSLNSIVSLRYQAGRVDLELDLFKDLSENAVDLYLILLDEDRFRVKCFKVDSLCASYTGTCYGRLDMDWGEFSKIKYYNFEIRKTQ